MSIYSDQLFVNAEVERRLELAGVTAHRHQPLRGTSPSLVRRWADRASHTLRDLAAPRPGAAREVAPCGPSVHGPRHS